MTSTIALPDITALRARARRPIEGGAVTRGYMADKFQEHSNDEQAHAALLAARIAPGSHRGLLMNRSTHS